MRPWGIVGANHLDFVCALYYLKRGKGIQTHFSVTESSGAISPRQLLCIGMGSTTGEYVWGVGCSDKWPQEKNRAPMFSGNWINAKTDCRVGPFWSELMWPEMILLQTHLQLAPLGHFLCFLQHMVEPALAQQKVHVRLRRSSQFIFPTNGCRERSKNNA